MDVEKTIQFLLEQQAKFDARQAELHAQFVERQAQSEKWQAQSEERISQIESILLDVAAAQERTNAILETLTERHVELEQSHKKLSDAQQVTQQNLNALAEVTTQKLNALIDTLERHIANHQ